MQGGNPDVAGYFLNPGLPERSLLRLISSQPARTLPEMGLQASPRSPLAVLLLPLMGCTPWQELWLRWQPDSAPHKPRTTCEQ